MKAHQFNKEGIKACSSMWMAVTEEFNQTGEVPFAIISEHLHSPKLIEQVNDNDVTPYAGDDPSVFIPFVMAQLGTNIDERHNVGLWTWFAFYHFNNLYSRQSPLGARCRYVLEEGRDTYFRYMLLGPITAYEQRQEKWLTSKTHVWGDTHEQIVKNPNVRLIPEVQRAVEILYQRDGKKWKPYRGKRFGLRQFTRELNQIALTYNLLSLSAEQIIQLLPRHFEALAIETNL